MEITIENMRLEDTDEVIRVFDENVAGEDLVLDSDHPKSLDMTSGRNLVARAKGRIVGWAVLETKDRSSPPGVAGISLFVRPEFRRIGVGRSLLNAAIDMSARSGITSLLASIVPKNVPALLLHKQCGFKAIGMVQRAGQARGQWQDAVLLQRQCG